MELLIVDDQTSVVNGLVKGIPWSKFGITNVFTAFNTQEAKEVLLSQQIDIMLCDIEMPNENGIALLQWARARKLSLECIFLTAHADFKYAQEAIQAGSFEYILQPAPYDEVQRVVNGAILKIMDKNSQKQVYAYGKVMMNKSEALRGGIFKQLISESITKTQYDKYKSVMKLPDLEQNSYTYLCQWINQGDRVQNFGDELLQFIIGNLSEELFQAYQQEVVVYHMTDSVFLVTLFSEKQQALEFENVRNQTVELLANLQKFYGLSAACYLSDPKKVQELKQTYEELILLKEKNVLSKGGVFEANQLLLNENDARYCLYDLSRWRQYLSNGLIETVREEMKQYLYRISDKNQFPPNLLHQFHLDLIRTVSAVMETSIIHNQDVMKQITNLKLYQLSLQSLSNMIQFIDEIMGLLIVKDDIKDIDIVEQVKTYIHNHIGEDIKRTDVANEVHLNLDYLARVFKKNTGFTIGDYVTNEKMQVAKNLIKTTPLPIKFVASRVGYDNFSHFSHKYKKIHGIAPSEERK